MYISKFEYLANMLLIEYYNRCIFFILKIKTNKLWRDENFMT